MLEPQLLIKLSLVLMIFFIIGAVGLYVVNRKKNAHDKREAWLKYILYLLIVWPMLFAFQWTNWGWWIIGLIAIGGAIELVLISKSKPVLRWASLLIYGSLMAPLIWRSNDQTPLVYLFFGVVIFDGFSQLIGQLLGGMKILPRISPKKTLSGLIGGVVVVEASFMFLFEISPIKSFPLLCVAPFVGDVLSSIMKRQAGVKDFNNLIPGHGGLLDRFDSFLFTLTVWSVLDWIQGGVL
jgi:phosphatidate cytidylyltransferase